MKRPKPPTAAEREAAFERRKKSGTWLLVSFCVVTPDGTRMEFKTWRGFDGVEYSGRDGKALERVLLNFPKRKRSKD